MFNFFSRTETISDRIEKYEFQISSLKSNSLTEKEFTKTYRLIDEILTSFTTATKGERPQDFSALVNSLVSSEFLLPFLKHINHLEKENRTKIYSILKYVFKYSSTDSYSQKIFSSNNKHYSILKSNYYNEKEVPHVVGECIRVCCEDKEKAKALLDLEFLEQIGSLLNCENIGLAADCLKVLNCYFYSHKDIVRKEVLDLPEYIEKIKEIFVEMCKVNNYIKRYFFETIHELIEKCEDGQKCVFYEEFLNDDRLLIKSLGLLNSNNESIKKVGILMVHKFANKEDRDPEINKFMVRNKKKIMEKLETCIDVIGSNEKKDQEEYEKLREIIDNICNELGDEEY